MLSVDKEFLIFSFIKVRTNSRLDRNIGEYFIFIFQYFKVNCARQKLAVFVRNISSDEQNQTQSVDKNEQLHFFCKLGYIPSIYRSKKECDYFNSNVQKLIFSFLVTECFFYVFFFLSRRKVVVSLFLNLKQY